MPDPFRQIVPKPHRHRRVVDGGGDPRGGYLRFMERFPFRFGGQDCPVSLDSFVRIYGQLCPVFFTVFSGHSCPVFSGGNSGHSRPVFFGGNSGHSRPVFIIGVILRSAAPAPFLGEPSRVKQLADASPDSALVDVELPSQALFRREALAGFVVDMVDKPPSHRDGGTGKPGIRDDSIVKLGPPGKGGFRPRAHPATPALPPPAPIGSLVLQTV